MRYKGCKCAICQLWHFQISVGSFCSAKTALIEKCVELKDVMCH